MPLNEGSGSTVYDQSGHRNNGTIYGASWVDDDRRGGKCLSFDGTDDTIITATSDIFKITEAVTLLVWYNPSATPAATKRLLSVEADGGGNQGIAINVNQAQGGAPTARAVACWFYDTNWRGTGANSLLTIGEWVCLAFTYNRVKAILYANAQPVDTRSYTGSMLMGANPRARVASYGAAGNFFAAGLVGECYVYNQALSDDEITKLYQGKFAKMRTG
jgi:hypothetical protein